MIIERTRRVADTGFEFLPKEAKPHRTTDSCRILPKHMVGYENYPNEIARFVAFGETACELRDAWNDGYRSFKIERGQPRDNNWETDEGETRESEEMIIREFKAIKKGLLTDKERQKYAADPEPDEADLDSLDEDVDLI